VTVNWVIWAVLLVLAALQMGNIYRLLGVGPLVTVAAVAEFIGSDVRPDAAAPVCRANTPPVCILVVEKHVTLNTILK
jgi:hypothetical protein